MIRRFSSYFNEEAGFNYEKYTGKLQTMFQQLINTDAPLQSSEEFSYPLNGKNIGNGETSRGNIPIKADLIGMTVGFEAAVAQLSNCLT